MIATYLIAACAQQPCATDPQPSQDRAAIQQQIDKMHADRERQRADAALAAQIERQHQTGVTL
jgi:hypothetical protein